MPQGELLVVFCLDYLPEIQPHIIDWSSPHCNNLKLAAGSHGNIIGMAVLKEVKLAVFVTFGKG